jgi:two-component system, NarL family, response regulator DevR
MNYSHRITPLGESVIREAWRGLFTSRIGSPCLTNALCERVVMSEVKSQIYLLAENRLFREALSRILNKKGDIRVAGAGPLGPEVAARIAELRPDILLADATAISASDAQIVPNLRKALPDLKVIMIGMDTDRELFLQAVRQGALGYVLKDASAQEVAAAVRAVINQEAVCPSSLLPVLFESVAQAQTARPTAQVKRELGLSRREQQLIHMISEGLTNKEIASRLSLSEQTVKNHVHRMLRKAGVTDRLMIVERWREVRSRSDSGYFSPAWSQRARWRPVG